MGRRRARRALRRGVPGAAGRAVGRGAAGHAVERGAVAVETALVTPLLLVVLLGVIELPMLIRDYVAVTSAARTAARVAAAEPGCLVKPAEPPCPATDPAPFAALAASAVGRHSTALPPDSIQYILVYKANAQGYPGAMSSMPTSCSGVPSCVGYTWNETAGSFVHSSGSWNRSTVNACFPNSIDAVGVQVVATHDFLSGLLGASMTMSDRAVMNFEPLPVGSCASGAHS